MATATDSTTFAAAYNALISADLIERSSERKIWVITDAGERVLHDHYDDSPNAR